MAKPVRFQFSLANNNITKHLQAIPVIYRALYVEMALDAWFNAEQGKGSGKMNSALFPYEQKETSKTVRFRLSISNEDIICRLRAIPSRHRSLVAEMALNTWIKTKPGNKVFKNLLSRNMKNSLDHSTLVSENFKQADNSPEPAQMEIEKESDTERLIKNALEFE